MKNYMLDVAFTVEGPWDEMEDIPTEQILLGLQRRLTSLLEAHTNKTEDVTEAFGFCDSYEIGDPPISSFREVLQPNPMRGKWGTVIEADGTERPAEPNPNWKTP
jgi:hypothetical protein